MYIEDISWPRGDTSERAAMKCSVYHIDTDEIPTKNTTFLNSFSKQQNSAIKVVTYRNLNACHKYVMKLGYKLIKEKERQ